MAPERIDQVEQDLRAHAKTLTELVQAEASRREQDEMLERLEALKEKHLNERLDHIEASIKAVYDLGKWLLTAAGATLIGLVVTFVVRGGLIG